MDLELVTIGTELLLGFTVDTNSAFAGQALGEIGVRITRRTSVPDEPAAVRDAVGDALARSRLVLTTGGLGPTRDDLSKNAVAELLGLPLEFRPEIWEALTARWARMGRRIGERNRCQAEVPRGAAVLPNPRGTAPGLWITADRGEVIMLPGVPSEMRGLVRDEVVPRLAAVEEGLAPLTLAYLPSLEGVDLRLTAWDATPEAAGAALAAGAARLREPLGDHCYAEGETDLAAVLLDACRAQRLTLAVAESCTGGMVGERITEIAGSSDVFRGGVIAYANGVKEAMLGVPARILEAEGAVSEGTARAMAEAAQSQLGASLAVAVSGVAGPAGGSDEKPVGTVWFAFAGPTGTQAERIVFPGSRHEIRVRACQFALFGLLRLASRGR